MQPYHEKNLIVNNRELNYKGILQVTELFTTINRALETRGYTKKEKRSEELVTEQGKQIFLDLRPTKVVTNYVTYMVRMSLTIDRMTETVEEVRGETRKFQNGDLKIVFDAWMLSDYENRWSMQPYLYFIKGLINKYVYQFPFEAKLPGELASDTAFIYSQIKKLLNSYRSMEKTRPAKEIDIIGKIAEDFGLIEREGKEEEVNRDEGEWIEIGKKK